MSAEYPTRGPSESTCDLCATHQGKPEKVVMRRDTETQMMRRTIICVKLIPLFFASAYVKYPSSLPEHVQVQPSSEYNKVEYSGYNNEICIFEWLVSDMV